MTQAPLGAALAPMGAAFALAPMGDGANAAGGIAAAAMALALAPLTNCWAFINALAKGKGMGFDGKPLLLLLPADCCCC